jgi:hypothetical protein
MVPSWGYQGIRRGKQAGYKADLLEADKKILLLYNKHLIPIGGCCDFFA